MVECCPGGITGSGDTTSGVVIVGIAPGRDEATRSHRCFTGPAGRLLDGILSAAGWDRSKTYCTNMLCWWKDAPEPDELAVCRPRFDREVAEAHPRLIIGLGAIVTQALLGEKKIGRVRGVPIWSPRYNCYIMCTYHPAAVLRGSHGMVYDILRDLAKIPTLLELESVPAPRIEYRVCTTAIEAQSRLDSLRHDIPIALDIETTHFTDTMEALSDQVGDEIDVFSERLLCFSISNGKFTFVIPADIATDLRWPVDVRWTFHNGQFDTQGLRRYLGVTLPIVEDTMLMSYALDERGSHKLKDLSREYCQAGFYEDEVRGQELFKQAAIAPLNHAQTATLHEYNAKDAHYTVQLHNTLAPRLAADNAERVYRELLIPGANMYAEAQYYGIAVDFDQVKEQASRWVSTMLLLEKRLQDEAQDLGFPGRINLSSPKQLSTFLYKVLGLQGGPSTAKDILEELDHPFIDGLLEHRQLEHMYQSYLVGVYKRTKKDGRVHPSIMLHGTVTGRRSYHDPAIQTIPKDPKLGELTEVKRIFKATSADYILLEMDYRQIEVWIGQALSGDQQMLADLQLDFDEHGPNYHSRIAEEVLGVPRTASNFYDTRQRAKRVTFGIMYLVGPKTLSHRRKGINCSISEAQSYLTGWYKHNSRFREWQLETAAAVRSEGEIVTPFGRKRRIPLVLDDRQIRQATNAPIQSTASDYPLSAAIEMAPLLRQFDSHILFDVHDSILLEVNRRYFHQTYKLAKEIMEKPRYEGGPSVLVDAKIGPNWYDVVEEKDWGRYV